MKEIFQALDNTQFRTMIFEEEQNGCFLFLPGNAFLAAVERGTAPEHSSATKLRRQILEFGAANVNGFGQPEY